MMGGQQKKARGSDPCGLSKALEDIRQPLPLTAARSGPLRSRETVMDSVGPKPRSDDFCQTRHVFSRGHSGDQTPECPWRGWGRAQFPNGVLAAEAKRPES